MRRVAIFSGVALAAIGIAFAVLPFAAPDIHYGDWQVTVVGSCSAPVVSAFQGASAGGWFGYAPLTSTPMENNVRVPTCRSEGQRRLQYGGMFLLAALVIGVAIRKAGDEEGDSPPNFALP